MIHSDEHGRVGSGDHLRSNHRPNRIPAATDTRGGRPRPASGETVQSPARTVVTPAAEPPVEHVPLTPRSEADRPTRQRARSGRSTRLHTLRVRPLGGRVVGPGSHEAMNVAHLVQSMP